MFYNVFHLLNFNREKIHSLFFLNELKKLDQINGEDNMKAENLFVVGNKIHRHLTDVINNSLFLRQGPFKMPPDTNMIHKSLSFEIFPSPSTKNNDRIWSQMRYVPHHLSESQANVTKKLILLFNGLGEASSKYFDECPVYRCELTGDQRLGTKADVIMWQHQIIRPNFKRPLGQIWAIYILESSVHSPRFPYFEKGPNSKINWTATFRRDSTIVAPYYKYTPYDLVNPPPEAYPLPEKNYAAGKTKMAAIFVSNCQTVNDRMSIVEKINNYIQVDVYGSCKYLQCSKYQKETCFEMLNKHYKFYLSFENSNCKDYVTEKFFLNGLSNNVIPIVMGAPPSYYKRIAPPHSYIHFEDFKTIKLLVDYLKYLDKNDTAYNEYFSWKGYGLVDTNTFFWCRLCMMAHEGDRVKTVFKNAFDWWNGTERKVCIGKQRWSDQIDIEM